MEIIIPDIGHAEEFSLFLKNAADESIYLSFDGKEAPSPEACMSMIKILSMGRNIIYLAMEDGRIIGSLTFRTRDNRKRLSHVGEIGIVVAKSHWGQGIGRLLMEAVITYAKKEGFHKINLKVIEGNEKAVKLYEGYGFKKEGLLIDEVFIEDSYYNYIMMGLILPDKKG